MVRRPGDDSKFPGGRAAERLKLFELQRGLTTLPEPPRKASRRPRAAREGPDDEK